MFSEAVFNLIDLTSNFIGDTFILNRIILRFTMPKMLVFQLFLLIFPSENERNLLYAEIVHL